MKEMMCKRDALRMNEIGKLIIWMQIANEPQITDDYVMDDD